METTLITWALGVIGSLGGLSSIIIYFSARRANKRIKNNEAYSGEIENLLKIIDGLKSDAKRQKERLDEQDIRIEHLEKKLHLKDGEIIGLEDHLNICLRAGHCQPLCEIHSDKCPIIIKYNELNPKKQ